MKIQIQEVLEKDQKRIKNLLDPEWRSFWKDQKYSWNNKNYFFVARSGRKIIGSIRFTTGGGRGAIHNLIVRKNMRSSGMGSLLLKKAESVIKRDKCLVITLQTTIYQKEAVKFYKKMDYKIFAKIKLKKPYPTIYCFIKRIK